MAAQDMAAGRRIDADGSLSTELEAQPRAGDPDTTGVVWGTCAEISMLGALGCGETLVRLVMQQLQVGVKYAVRHFASLRRIISTAGEKKAVGFRGRIASERKGG
jgi:hypothetical protein